MNFHDENTVLDYVISNLSEHGKVGNIDGQWLIKFRRKLLEWAEEEGVKLRFDYRGKDYKNRIYLRKVNNF